MSRNATAYIGFLTLALAAATVPNDAFSQGWISHGPMVGAITPDGAKVWVRWSEPGSVSLQYRLAGADTFSDGGGLAIGAASDYTGIFGLTGLVPGETYEYRLRTLTAAGDVRRSTGYFFRTPPSAPTSLTFSVLADFAVKLKSSQALRTAAASKPDFVAIIGDLDHRDPAKDPDTGELLAAEDAPIALEQMRAMRRDMRDPASPIGADFAGAFIKSDGPGNPQIPLYNIWDDHDFCANNIGANCGLGAQSVQVFSEYFMPPPDNGISGSACASRGDWQRLDFGALASIFMLDLRSQRIDSGGEKNLLGSCQQKWLIDGLNSSTARWKVILTPVTFNPLTKPWDGWAGFLDERQKIVEFLGSNAISGVVFVSGDIHSGGAIDDGTNSGFPEVAVPHANMPDTWVNTYCRVGRGGNGVVTSAPGTWTIGALTDPNIGGGTPTCLGKSYPGRTVSSLPPPPYPLDGTRSPGYVRVSLGTQAVFEILDSQGVIRKGRRADGTVGAMRLTIQSPAGTVLTGE